MIIKEIIDMLKDMSNKYNHGNNNFYKWCEVPLLSIEGSNNMYVSDPVILERMSEGLKHCKEYLDLPTVDFRVQHLLMMSDNIVMITIFWDFFNTSGKVRSLIKIVSKIIATP